MTASRHLTPMEELFFWDDRPAYPCACFFRAEFRGALNRLELEAAIAQSLRRFPLLCSKVRFDSAGRLQWLVPEKPQFTICWDQETRGNELPKARRIDLCVETGIRFYATEGGDRSVLIIQFHHACSDALGIMRYLRDLVATYSSAAGTAQVALTEEPTLKQSRRKRWWPPTRMPQALWRAWLIARRRPLSLIAGQPPHPDSALHEDYPTAIWQTLDTAETALLARAASRQKVTFNDLLLRDYLLALADWRGPDGITGQSGWVRVLVPELTEKARAQPGSTPDPVSTLFLDVHTKEIRSPDLLAKIHGDMMAKKLAGDGDLLRLGVALDRRLGGNPGRHVRANKCLFTTVFSNLGKVPMDAPGPSQKLLLESVHAVHVVRLYTPVNFMVMTIAGCLSLTMSFDSRVIQRAEAEALFQGLLGKLRDSIKAGS